MGDEGWDDAWKLVKGAFTNRLPPWGIRAQCFQHRRSHVTSFLGYLFNDSHPLLVAVCSWRHYLPRTLVCPICEPGLLLWPEKDLGVVKVLEVICHHICYKCACNYTCNVFAANSLQNDSLYRCPSWYSYSCVTLFPWVWTRPNDSHLRNRIWQGDRRLYMGWSYKKKKKVSCSLCLTLMGKVNSLAVSHPRGRPMWPAFRPIALKGWSLLTTVGVSIDVDPVLRQP